MKEEATERMRMGDVLKARMKSNEPVLEHLPEVTDILPVGESLFKLTFVPRRRAKHLYSML
jgi:hypothetical protein